MVTEQSHVVTDSRDPAASARTSAPIIRPAGETRQDEPEWRVSPYCCGIIEEPAPETGDGAPGNRHA